MVHAYKSSQMPCKFGKRVTYEPTLIASESALTLVNNRNTPCSSVSIVNFKHVNVNWVIGVTLIAPLLL